MATALLPTRAEIASYPVLFTWAELKDIIRRGDLGALKRHPDFEKRYQEWRKEAIAEHGSMEAYIVKHRLGWDLSSPCALPTLPTSSSSYPTPPPSALPTRTTTPTPSPTPEYFTPTSPPNTYTLLHNDWPYSLPHNIEHHVLWSRLPLLHRALSSADEGWARVCELGVYGFTGAEGEGEGVEDAVKEQGRGIAQWMRGRWDERGWETAWFVNPPRLQSVPGLAHFHIFVRRKDGKEEA